MVTSIPKFHRQNFSDPNRYIAMSLISFCVVALTGTEEGEGTTTVVKAGEIRRRKTEEEEMEQG